MKRIITIVFCFYSLVSFGQSDEEEKQTVVFGRIGELTDEQISKSGSLKLNFVTDEEEAERLAKNDIKNRTPFLLLMSGVAPAIITTDSEFENKYGVYFYEYGCGGPEHEVIIAYNRLIFNFLTKRYGSKWKQMPVRRKSPIFGG